MIQRAIPAAAYLRMSTDLQEDSPQQQRKELLKLAERDGFRIIRWYQDLAVSGDEVEKRPQFSQLLRDAAHEADFEVILCWDQDRFSRADMIEIGKIIAPLRKANIRLVTVAQGAIDWNDFAGQITYLVSQHGKHQFLRDLSRNSLRGRLSKVKEGSLLNQAPLGMCRVFCDPQGKEMHRARSQEEFRRPKGWTVHLAPTHDDNERDAVIWAFEAFASGGHSLSSIRRGLAKRGIFTKNGRLVCIETIAGMFHNVKYIGHLEFGRFTKGKYHRWGEDGEIRPTRSGEPAAYKKPAIVTVRDAHEPLIPESVFFRCQERLAMLRRKNYSPRKKDFLLAGLIVCPECGCRFRGMRQRHRGRGIYEYYLCKGSNGAVACSGYCVRRDTAERVVLQRVRELLCGKETLQRIKVAIKQQVALRNERDASKRLRNQLVQVKGKIEGARRAMALAEHDDLPTMQQVLCELKGRQRDLEAELRQCKKASPKHLEREALAKIKALDQQLTGESIAANAALHELLERIEFVFVPAKSGNRKYNVDMVILHVRTGGRALPTCHPLKLAEGLNNAQRFLEYAGLVPGIGEVADVINAIIYLARGRRWDAALSFAAVIPVVGSVGAKAARKILYSRQAAEAVIKLSRDTEAIGKAVDELRRLGRRDSELRAIGDGLRVNHAPPALPPAELDGLVKSGEAVKVDVAGGHSYYQTPHGVYRCSKFCQRVSPDNLAKLSPDTGGGLGGAARRGTLVGSLDDLTQAEREFVERTLASGKNVEVIPTGANRTPDFLIDGVRKELKTVSGVANQTSDGISGAIANRVMNGRGQAVHIVVDATNQPGITREIAERGIRRAFGADNATGGKIQSIQVVGPDFDMTVPRM